MKCPKCGTEFSGDKCPVCGYEVTDYDRAIDSLMRLTGIGKKRAEELYKAGYKDIESIKRSSKEELAKVKGIGRETAKKIKEEADKVSIRICPVCGAIVPEDATVCPRCGSPLPSFEEEKKEEKEEIVEEEKKEEGEIRIGDVVVCPNCGALIPKGSEICPVCGADLKNVKLEEPKPLEDPMEILRRVFGVSELPRVEEEEKEVKIRICPNCGAIVVNSDTCPVCGAKIPEEIPAPEEEEINLSEKLEVCPNCGAFIPPDAKVCPVCGAKIGEEKGGEAEVSLGEILNAVAEPEVEQENIEIPQPEGEIGIEELEEIEKSMKEEEKEVKIPEIEIGLKELEEIESSVKKEEEIKKEEIPEREIERKEIPKVKEEREIETGFTYRLNNLFENIGTKEDILSFTPLLVSFLYIVSINFLSSTSREVFNSTVSFFMLSLSMFFGFEIYLTIRKSDFKSLFLGFAMCLISGFLFLPYSLYFVIILSGIFIYLKRVYYYIPFAFYSILFTINLNYSIEITIIFLSLFIIHLIARYEEVNLIVVKPTIPTNKSYEEGMVAFKEKRYHDAIYLLRKSLIANPKNVNILNSLGLAYGRIGNFVESIKIFQRIIEIQPGYKYAWNNLGNIYARMGDYEKAMNCYRKALEIDPKYGDALLNIGYVMIRRGQYEEAVKVAEKIKSEI